MGEGVSSVETINPQVSTLLRDSSSRELLHPATPKDQIRACLISLWEAKRVIGEPNKQAVPDIEAGYLVLFSKLVGNLYSDHNLNDNPAIAEQVVKTTIALFDLTVVDEINADSPGSTSERKAGKAGYYRDAGYFNEDVSDIGLTSIFNPRLLFGVEGEIAVTIGRLAKTKARFLPVSLIMDLRKATPTQAPDVVFLDHFAKGEIEINELVGQAKRSYPNAVIIAPFQLNSQIQGLFIENTFSHSEKDTPSDSFKKIANAFSPVSEIPRQEIWKALLEKGRALFLPPNTTVTVVENKEDEPPDSAELVKELDSFLHDIWYPEDRYKQYLYRKSKVWLKAAEQKIEAFKEKHREHYHRLLFDRVNSEHGAPEVILTRSGVSANETAILAIASLTGNTKQERPLLYTMDGFYYEDLDTLANKFRVTRNPQKARVILINNEPSDPFRSLPYPSKYIQAREKLIYETIEAARNNPAEKYYIVYDKTTNLLKETFSQGEQLPANLTIIETASLSKQQRGGRNYFFGALGAWGDKEIVPHLYKAIDEAHGNLTPLGIVHLPRLRRLEIVEQLNSYIDKNLAIADEVEKIQASMGLPKELYWKAQPQTFFCFLVPPAKELMRLLSLYYGSNRAEDIKDILGFDPSLKTLPAEMGLSGTTIEYGDSFGLDNTRLVGFLDSGGLGDKRVLDPIMDEYGIFRISPGIKTSETELRDFIESLLRPALVKLRRVFPSEFVFGQTDGYNMWK